MVDAHGVLVQATVGGMGQRFSLNYLMVQLTSALVLLGVAASLVDLILSLTPYSRALEERIPRNDHAFPCLARIPCCGCGGSCTPSGDEEEGPCASRGDRREVVGVQDAAHGSQNTAMPAAGGADEGATRLRSDSVAARRPGSLSRVGVGRERDEALREQLLAPTRTNPPQ